MAKRDQKPRVEFDLDFFEISVCKNKKLQPFFNVFHFGGANFEEQKLGQLFGLIQVFDHSKNSAYLPNVIAQVIKKEFFKNLKKNTEEAFEAALHKGNLAMRDLAQHEIVEWMGNFNAVIGVIQKNNFYFTQAGGGRILLIRNKLITDISRGLDEGEGIGHPIKTFSNTSAGKLQDKDKLLFVTETVFDAIGWETLKRHTTAFNQTEFDNIFRSSLELDGDQAGSIVINVQEKIIQPKVPKKMPAVEKINFFGENEKTAKIADQVAISTQEASADTISPNVVMIPPKATASPVPNHVNTTATEEKKAAPLPKPVQDTKKEVATTPIEKSLPEIVDEIVEEISPFKRNPELYIKDNEEVLPPKISKKDALKDFSKKTNQSMEKAGAAMTAKTVLFGEKAKNLTQVLSSSLSQSAKSFGSLTVKNSRFLGAKISSLFSPNKKEASVDEIQKNEFEEITEEKIVPEKTAHPQPTPPPVMRMQEIINVTKPKRTIETPPVVQAQEDLPTSVVPMPEDLPTVEEKPATDPQPILLLAAPQKIQPEKILPAEEVLASNEKEEQEETTPDVLLEKEKLEEIADEKSVLLKDFSPDLEKPKKEYGEKLKTLWASFQPKYQTFFQTITKKTANFKLTLSILALKLKTRLKNSKQRARQFRVPDKFKLPANKVAVRKFKTASYEKIYRPMINAQQKIRAQGKLVWHRENKKVMGAVALVAAIFLALAYFISPKKEIPAAPNSNENPVYLENQTPPPATENLLTLEILTDTNQDVTKIVGLREQIFILTNSGNFLAFDPKNNNLQKIDLPGELKNVKTIAAMPPLQLIFLVTPQTVYSYSPVTSRFEANKISLPTNFEPIAADTYLTYIYLLDKKSGQVYQYPRATGGFGEQKIWLRDNLDANAISSIYVDGFVHIGFADGSIKRYSRGKVDEGFNFNNPDAKIKPFKIQTTQEGEKVYLLDSENGQLIYLKANGEIEKQLTDNQLDGAKDFWIDTKSQQLYLVNKDNQLLRTKL